MDFKLDKMIPIDLLLKTNPQVKLLDYAFLKKIDLKDVENGIFLHL